MPRPYRDSSLMAEAQRLYVEDGLTIAEIAGKLPVSERTLSDWSVKFEWVRRRQAQLSRESEVRGLLKKIELRLATMALGDDIDPQQIYALARVVAVLKPAAAIALREMDRADADASPEDKMAAVRELLTGARIKAE